MALTIRDEIVDLPAMQVDNQWYQVWLQIWHDGTKFAGRLWFTGPGTGDGGMPGRRLFYGTTREELLGRVEELGDDQMRGQFRHAMVDRRRYLPLRAVTEEILHNIRVMNQVAVDLRSGNTPAEQAEREMEQIEERLRELVAGLRSVAGIEEVTV